MIQEGRYKARALEGALGRAGTGSEQIAVLLEITEGEHKGHQLTWYGYFTEKTVDRTFESLRHLGWEGDDLTDLRGIESNEVTIVVELEYDRDGEQHARVKWINSPGSGLAMRERLDDAAARVFAQRMKGAAVASRAKAKSNGSSARAPAGPAVSSAVDPANDDIPFAVDATLYSDGHDARRDGAWKVRLR